MPQPAEVPALTLTLPVVETGSDGSLPWDACRVTIAHGPETAASVVAALVVSRTQARWLARVLLDPDSLPV